MSATPPRPAPASRPLARRAGVSDRELTALLLLSGLATVVALVAFATAFSANFVIGGSPTARASGIGGHAKRVACWALATPGLALVVLRTRRLAWLAVAMWLVLDVWCAWWWWPGRPEDDFDFRDPLWHSRPGLIAWLLVAAGIAVGVHAAWRSRSVAARVVAVVLAVALTTGGVLAYAHLVERARAERPVPLPEGPAEVRAARHDPLWARLPPGALEESAAARTAVGDRDPSTVRRLVGTRRLDRSTFARIVEDADATGWQLTSTRCTATGLVASFAKSLHVGPARLRVETATYTKGVDVTLTVTDQALRGPRTRCW